MLAVTEIHYRKRKLLNAIPQAAMTAVQPNFRFICKQRKIIDLARPTQC